MPTGQQDPPTIRPYIRHQFVLNQIFSNHFSIEHVESSAALSTEEQLTVREFSSKASPGDRCLNPLGVKLADVAQVEPTDTSFRSTNDVRSLQMCDEAPE